MPRSWSRIGGWRLKYEQIPIVKRPIDVLNRVLVILMHVFSQDEYNFLRTIASNNSLPFNFDIYRASEAEQDKLLDLLKTNYDRGYRIFISTQGSFDLEPIFGWLNSRPDVLVINTPSTLSLQNYSAIFGVDVLPYNLIRTAIPDNEMILTLFKDILFRLPSILKTSEQNELYEPLQNIPSEVFPFNNIVYIHIPSGYTNGYLQTLTETMNILNLNVELTVLEIKVTVIKDEYDTIISTTYELPNDAKYYLAYNNIKNDSYKNSNDKPLIILNCEPDVKNELMNLLNNVNYYDNYTLLSDSFATVFPTSHNFTAALMPIGNFSRRGYVLSSIVDDTQSISPFILNIFEIFSNCGKFFQNFLNNNFRASNLITQLINVKIMKTNSWSDKNLIVSKIQRTADISTDTSWKWEILFKKQSYNFEEIAIISSSTQVITYPDNMTDFGYGDINNFETNQLLTTVACTGTNINTTLDNKYLVLPSEQYIINYKNFLLQNYNKQFPLILFNQYTLFVNVNTYNISVKQLEQITIDVIIEIDDFLDNNKLINIHIPEIVYDVNEYFYDTSGNGSYIDEYTREFKTDGSFNLITDGSFNITNLPLIDSFDLFIFKGHIVRIGKDENVYFDGDISFNTLKTVRGYVNQPVKLNYLVIEHDYTVGDKIIEKCPYTSCEYLNKGVIHDISANKYYVDISFAVYKDPSSGFISNNVIKYGFTQEQIYPDPSFNLSVTAPPATTGTIEEIEDDIPVQQVITVGYESSGNIITYNNLGNVITYSADGLYILTYDMCGNLISTMPRPPTIIAPSNELLDTYVIGISAEELTVSGYTVYNDNGYTVYDDTGRTVYDNNGNLIVSYDNNGVITVDNRPPSAT